MLRPSGMLFLKMATSWFCTTACRLIGNLVGASLCWSTDSVVPINPDICSVWRQASSHAAGGLCASISAVAAMALLWPDERTTAAARMMFELQFAKSINGILALR
jgi:hypothetical protein